MKVCPHCLKDVPFRSEAVELINKWENALGSAYGVVWCGHCKKPAFHLIMQVDQSGKVTEAGTDQDSVVVLPRDMYEQQ